MNRAKDWIRENSTDLKNLDHDIFPYNLGIELVHNVVCLQQKRRELRLFTFEAIVNACYIIHFSSEEYIHDSNYFTKLVRETNFGCLKSWSNEISSEKYLDMTYKNTVTSYKEYLRTAYHYYLSDLIDMILEIFEVKDYCECL